jgi:hypothetical protein
LLDTNAVRDLFRVRKVAASVLPQLRARIMELASNEEVRFVMTQPVLWELTSIIDDQTPGEGGRGLYEQTVGFYAEVGQRWYLKHEYDRKRLELKLRWRLTPAEAFEQINPRGLLDERLLNDDWIKLKAGQQQGEKLEERQEEANKRSETIEEMVAKLGPDWRSKLANDFALDKREAVVRKFVRLELRRWARREKREIRGAAWPVPHHLPTFWFSESFYFAKVRRVWVDKPARDVLSRSSIKDMPDLIDATHFRDAAYADVLVTSDQILTEVGNAAGVALRIVDLAEFARELGIV